MNVNKISRLEVIDHSGETLNDRGEIIEGKGRAFVKYFPEGLLSVSIQDDGRTMKFFIEDFDDEISRLTCQLKETGIDDPAYWKIWNERAELINEKKSR